MAARLWEGRCCRWSPALRPLQPGRGKRLLRACCIRSPALLASLWRPLFSDLSASLPVHRRLHVATGSSVPSAAYAASSLRGARTRLARWPPPPPQSAATRRPFASSSRPSFVSGLLNRPVLVYALLAAGGLVALKLYLTAQAEDEQELRLLESALSLLSASSVAQQIHGPQRLPVKAVIGQRLSGFTADSAADVWYEVRFVTVTDKGERGDTLGVHKLRVTASREQPQQPQQPTQQPQPAAAATPASSPAAVPQLGGDSRGWLVSSLLLTSPTRQLSFAYDAASGAFTRCPSFIPVTQLPSKPPDSGSAALTAAPAASNSAASSSSSSSSSSLSPSSGGGWSGDPHRPGLRGGCAVVHPRLVRVPRCAALATAASAVSAGGRGHRALSRQQARSRHARAASGAQPLVRPDAQGGAGGQRRRRQARHGAPAGHQSHWEDGGQPSGQQARRLAARLRRPPHRSGTAAAQLHLNSCTLA